MSAAQKDASEKFELPQLEGLVTLETDPDADKAKRARGIRLVEFAIKQSVEWKTGSQLVVKPTMGSNSYYIEKLGFNLISDDQDRMLLNVKNSSKWCKFNDEWRVKEYLSDEERTQLKIKD